MKTKIIIAALTLSIIFALTGCGNNANNNNSGNTPNDTTTNDNTNNMNNDMNNGANNDLNGDLNNDLINDFTEETTDTNTLANRINNIFSGGTDGVNNGSDFNRVGYIPNNDINQSAYDNNLAGYTSPNYSRGSLNNSTVRNNGEVFGMKGARNIIGNENFGTNNVMSSLTK